MAPPRVAWFHPFAGIAGDMALGSLIDAGAPVEEVVAALERLKVPGLSLTAEVVLRAGLRATRVVVAVEEDGVRRGLAQITTLLDAAALPERVAARALAVFTLLAEVEGGIHGVEPSEVHFHEVGGHDALADVVGTATALELLGVDEVYSGPVAQGVGTVRSAHGLLPNPPPAVLALLRGAPLYGRDIPVELTTPTGAALLAALASGFGPLPAMSPEAVGYGAGSRELEGLPNVTQVVIGTTAAPVDTPAGQLLTLVEANLDDVTGERLADALEALFEAGALDAWITPVLMKKGRPGHLLSALVEPVGAAGLRGVLLRESGSFGVRTSLVDRYAVAREMVEVEVAGERLRVKVGGARAKVEHDDARLAARRLGLGVDEVVSRAEEAYRRLAGEATP
ncbi:MAG TPA: nickel pincer cofactor biosynthesis protein LarC [Acidimicrobiales bacterium]|nr:nickel pincer cofactor biosynthesis protein LarC [Acidimicrobiales bacterium]